MWPAGGRGSTPLHHQRLVVEHERQLDLFPVADLHQGRAQLVDGNAKVLDLFQR
jgi:hypothetical protein